MSPTLWIATRKGLFAATRGAAGWQLAGEPAFLGDPVTLVLHDPRDGLLYAALNLGHFGVKLRRSADGGRSWTEVAAPAYPPKPEGHPDEKTPWSLQLLWSLVPGTAAQPGRLWAGTIPGGLFRSDDRGESWQLVESLWNHPRRTEWGGGGYDHPGIHSVCVDPRDPRRLLVAISTGGVWRSEDDGATWALIGEGLEADYMPEELKGDPIAQDAHLVAACPSAPDVLWMQHHCGIFRSTDGGLHWQRLKPAPSSFGFAVAVHPARPDTAWFVPAIKDEKRVPVDGRLVVNRTQDGGRSFESVAAGLPPPPAYDLVYRHGLAVDATGQRLAMGSTTGAAWTSDDGGSNWQLLSAHLPPISAVTFGG